MRNWKLKLFIPIYGMFTKGSPNFYTHKDMDIEMADYIYHGFILVGIILFVMFLIIK